MTIKSAGFEPSPEGIPNDQEFTGTQEILSIATGEPRNVSLTKLQETIEPQDFAISRPRKSVIVVHHNYNSGQTDASPIPKKLRDQRHGLPQAGQTPIQLERQGYISPAARKQRTTIPVGKMRSKVLSRRGK